MTAADAQQAVPQPEWAPAAPPKRRRRSVWPWIVTAVIVLVLAVAAWFAAEWIARVVVENTIRSEVVTNLALPADQPVDVVVVGAVLPQLIAGSLDEVTISSEDVPLDAASGDVTVQVEGLPIRGGLEAEAATATLRLDEAQLRDLMSTVDGFPADSLGLADPNVTIANELKLLGVGFPVGVALTPSAAAGDIVLTPAGLQLAGAEISAAGLKERFGRIADAVLRPWTVCIAQYIPAGVVLDSVAVDGDHLVADLDIDGAIIADPALQENGTCA